MPHENTDNRINSSRKRTSLSFISIAVALGLMFSPDTLVVLGNGAGAAGWLTLLFVLVGILIHMATIDSYRTLHSVSGNHIRGFQQVLGRRLASAILVCGKLPLAVCASAGLAVTAGFVFNEVFVYWFPNFTFAFLILGIAAAVNMFSQRLKFTLQIAAVLGVFLAMFILIGFGLFAGPPPDNLPQTGVSFDYRYLLVAIALLVGFDMGLYAGCKDHDRFSRQSRSLAAALIAGGLLLVLWGFAALSVVPSAKLESSSIPHMIMARKVLGQPGRLIMGAAVICGVFAAVNSLMHSTGMMLGQITSAGGNRDFVREYRASILLIAISSAVLMAMGLAGDFLLETWIRSSLFLWLLYYVFISIAAYLSRRQTATSNGENRPVFAVWTKILSAAGTAAAATGLVLLEPEPSNMLIFLAAVVTGITAVVVGVDFISEWINRKKNAQTNLQRPKT